MKGIRSKAKRYIELIVQIATLDIFRLNYGLSNKSMGRIDSHPEVTQRGVLYEIGRYIYNCAINITNTNGPSSNHSCRDRVLVFVASDNQYKALEPVTRRLSSSIIFGVNIDNKHIEQWGLLQVYIVSVIFAPILVFEYTTANTLQKRSIRKSLHNYLLTYGHFVVSYLRIRKLSPKSLLISNDHVFWTCTIAKVARTLNIPVIYMQHAPVTRNFPPLTCDYAFLNGRDALDKYKHAGISSHTTVFLTGIPKFDKYSDEYNSSNRVEHIGICTNRLDPIDKAEKVVKLICDIDATIDLWLRPHPADNRRKVWRKLSDDYGVAFSNPEKEESFAFLDKVDAIIAGQSGIHLEACLMNVIPISFDFSNMGGDRYEFDKFGLTKTVEDTEGLKKIIKQYTVVRPDVRSNAKRYCETIDTHMFGKSSKLVSELIGKISHERSSQRRVLDIDDIDSMLSKHYDT